MPHHLTAADLVARTFAAIEPEAFDRIVILFPDHFRRTRRPFASTQRPFDTIFGPVCTDQASTQLLLRRTELVEESDLFERDHGIGAILPFIRRFLPAVPIVPVAVSVASRRAEWDALIAVLEPIVTARTLVVQSTDFSHYLSPGEAALRDQMTLNLIAAFDLDRIARLTQPAYLDSAGSQYIQMKLQAGRSSAPLVLFNVNSQSYSDEYQPETTSYVLQIYPREPVNRVLPPLEGSRVVCFAGDFFTGRFLAPLLEDRRAAELIQARVQHVLNGCPLVVNLEGVFGRVKRPATSHRKLVMNATTAIDWLARLNVKAASVANNHSHDHGSRAYRRMVSVLRKAGVRPLEHARLVDLEGFRIVALTDLDNTRRPATDRITAREIAAIGRSPARPPLLALIHWGKEFADQPGPREEELARRLDRAAVNLIVGAHPHVASRQLAALRGGESLLAYSLGNFLFDQPGPRSSGAILEVRLFGQGTFFARLVPMPNLYDETIRVRRTGP